MSSETMEALSMTMVITSVAAVESRRLTLAAAAYTAQALLLVGILVGFAGHNAALYWWAATALLTKAVLVPWALFWAIRRTSDRELRPVIGFAPSVLFAAVLMVALFRLTHSQADLLATSSLAQEAVFRTNLAVAATVFVLGLYCVLTRRDAIKTVMGLCLLENGVHLSLVSLAPDLPETALFGVATEVVVTVYLLLYVIIGVKQAFGTTDTFALKELRE